MDIDEKTNKILTDLKSTDPLFIIETIDHIRESGNGPILVALIDLLHETLHPEIKKSILGLLSEIKDKAGVPTLVDAIRNNKYYNERRDLVASCWQNGLSYIEYLPFFIDLIIHEEFSVAFEAFTAVENMYGAITDDVIDLEIVKINNSLMDANGQKAYLLNEALSAIRNIPLELGHKD